MPNIFSNNIILPQKNGGAVFCLQSCYPIKTAPFQRSKSLPTSVLVRFKCTLKFNFKAEIPQFYEWCKSQKGKNAVKKIKMWGVKKEKKVHPSGISCHDQAYRTLLANDYTLSAWSMQSNLAPGCTK